MKNKNMVTKPKIIDVEMASLEISSEPNILRSSGIGSCLVITIYDIEKKIGGLAHVMLPNSNNASSYTNPNRFVDRAIEIMLEKIEKLGSKRTSLEAKVIGGASMFKVLSTESGGIGSQNIEAAKKKLAQEDIKVVSSATGGNSGRSVEFDLKTGLVTIKTRI